MSACQNDELAVRNVGDSRVYRMEEKIRIKLQSGWAKAFGHRPGS